MSFKEKVKGAKLKGDSLFTKQRVMDRLAIMVKEYSLPIRDDDPRPPLVEPYVNSKKLVGKHQTMPTSRPTHSTEKSRPERDL
jgi:hypothetical protein